MIFFDIDGTLVDFKRAEYLGVKAFYKQYKKSFRIGEELFYKYWSEISKLYFDEYLEGKLSFKQQRIKRFKAVFSLSNIELTDEEAWNKYLVYKKHFEDNWQLFSDVITCLRSLSSYDLGIISNGDFTQQTVKLERMGIHHYFKEIITAGEFGVSKPDTEIFKIACNKVNTSIGDCWYIGDDYKTDILPCYEIGMKCILVNRKQLPIIDDNIVVVDNLLDIVSIIKEPEE